MDLQFLEVHKPIGAPADLAADLRPFNPAKNGPGKPLEMVWDQREGLLLGGFP